MPAPAPDRRQLANGKLAYLTQILVDQTLLGGGTVILQDHYEPAATLDAIERERITHLFLVEPQLFGLMDDPAVPSRDLSSLRVLTHIGAMAAPVLRRRARMSIGPVIAHTYGASEIGIVSALTPAEHDRPSRFRCAGRIQPGVDVRFRRHDGSLDPRAGAIEVRSPAMAQGYRHRPVEEAENFTGGWYRTGDLGALDGEDMLQILGRAVDIGQSGVSPVALQDTLCRQPSVRYAVLVADPGQGWIAAAEAWPGGTVDVEAVPRRRRRRPRPRGRRFAAADAGGPDPAHRAGQAQPSRHPRRRPGWGYEPCHQPQTSVIVLVRPGSRR